MTDAQVLPPLVVNTDPSASAKSLTPVIVVLQVFIVVFNLAALAIAALSGSYSGFGLGFASGLPIVVSIAFFVYLLTRLTAQRGSLSVVRPALIVDYRGLTSTIPQGSVTVPWSAIESITARKRAGHTVITYRLVRTTTPATPGVVSTLAPASFRYLVKKGFALGSAAIDVPIQTVLDATAAFTQGRIVLR